jgi:hypothetical protein
MQYGKRQDRNKVLPRIFKVCFSILQFASPEAGIFDGVQGEGDQEGASTPAESVRCFMQCASGARAARLVCLRIERANSSACFCQAERSACRLRDNTI